MFDYINIADIEILKDKIPSEFQFWHCFGNILELNYSSKAIDGFYCDYTQIQSLCYLDKQYKIELYLYNIIGNLNFDMMNTHIHGTTLIFIFIL